MQLISYFKLSFLSILLLLVTFSSYSYALEEGTNKEDFFPIGVYYVAGQKTVQSDTDDPNNPSYVPLENDFRYSPEVAEDEYFQEFQDLKSYGFNSAILIINPLVHPSAEQNTTRAKGVINGLISAAEKASLQIVVPVNKTTSLLSQKNEYLSKEAIENVLLSDYIDLYITSSAILGYQLFDEPVPFGEGGNYGPFAKEVIETQLGQVNDILQDLDNNAFTLSTWNNINSMELLNSGMHPDVLLMDLYPFAQDAYNGAQADGDTPFGDLSDAFPRGRADDGSFNLGKDQPSFSESIIYAQNIAKEKAVWVALQAFGGDTYWRKPVPKELRLQAFTAIKNGAKGLFYFIYQSESWIEGMMDVNYQETPLILEAKEINKKVHALAPTLLKLTKDSTHASSRQSEVETFIHNNDKKYLIAVNGDINHTTTVTIAIDDTWISGIAKATDIYTGEHFMMDASNKLTLPIQAADARVLLLESNAIPKTEIKTDKDSYLPTDKIHVTYSGMKGDAEGDWLAIFPKKKPSAGEFIVDAENDTAWIFTAGKTAGEVTFNALDLTTIPEGEYEVRAFFNDSYKVEALYTFSIKAAPQIEQTTIKTDKDSYLPTDKIHVTYSGMKGDAEGDWLAIFPKKKPSAGEFILDAENDTAWIFTAGKTAGEVTFNALDLATLPKGEYQVRAFFNDSYEVEALYTFSIK